MHFNKKVYKTGHVAMVTVNLITIYELFDIFSIFIGIQVSLTVVVVTLLKPRIVLLCTRMACGTTVGVRLSTTSSVNSSKIARKRISFLYTAGFKSNHFISQ